MTPSVSQLRPTRGAAAAGTDSRFSRMACPASWLHQVCVCLSTFLPETGRGFSTPGPFHALAKLFQELSAYVRGPHPSISHVARSRNSEMSTGRHVNVARNRGHSDEYA